jgi:endonuclease/exonuclease/phosphatase family metal-dependent hydrolase
MCRGTIVRTTLGLVLLLAAGIGLGLLDPPAVAGEKEGEAIRVMSFNVRLGVADDGENSWEHRRALLARTIQDFDPDLLGTQETWPFQAEYLLEQLPGREYVGWPRQPGNERDGEECGILFRTDRFEKQDAGQFWLSETPEVPASRSWDSSLPRVATWVKLRDRRGGGDLVFVNTHFDHRGARARLESARLLRERLGELAPSGAWILTGDFNAGDDSPPYAALVGGGEGTFSVVDSYRAVHPERRDDEGTFSAFRGRRSGPRIDWVLHGGAFETLSAAIDRTEEQGRNPSDHYPVTAVVKWTR